MTETGEYPDYDDQTSLFFFSSRRRHTRLQGDWSSDVCSSDLRAPFRALLRLAVSANPKGLSSVVHHLLPRLPQSVDSKLHHIARFQILRRLHPQDRKSVV